MDIKKALQPIGCTKNEIETFIALLPERKGATVLQLSKKLNLPRATIYGHLDSLIEKGIAKKGLDETGTIFFTEDLNTIAGLYDEKVKRVEQAKKSLEALIRTQDFNSSYNPKFVLYDNPKAAESILRDVLRSREEQTYWFWPASEMLKTIPRDIFSDFHKERIKRGIHINVLWPRRKKVKISSHPLLGSGDEKKSLRRVKILPEKIDQTMGYGIYGTKVAFISSRRENYGFVIDSRELAETFKSQFDYFWKISLKYTV